MPVQRTASAVAGAAESPAPVAPMGADDVRVLVVSTEGYASIPWVTKTYLNACEGIVPARGATLSLVPGPGRPPDPKNRSPVVLFPDIAHLVAVPGRAAACYGAAADPSETWLRLCAVRLFEAAERVGVNPSHALPVGVRLAINVPPWDLAGVSQAERDAATARSLRR